MVVKPFEMAVEDTFHFEGGKTVFVGMIETESNSIGPCDCEIVLGNEVQASIRIVGEVISMKKQRRLIEQSRARNRSVSLPSASRDMGS